MKKTDVTAYDWSDFDVAPDPNIMPTHQVEIRKKKDIRKKSNVNIRTKTIQVQQRFRNRVTSIYRKLMTLVYFKLQLKSLGQKEDARINYGPEDGSCESAEMSSIEKGIENSNFRIAIQQHSHNVYTTIYKYIICFALNYAFYL